MKLLQCVSLLLCLHFVKSHGVKPNILKTSGYQENKYVLNTGENETNDREKETEITSSKDVVNEVYNIPVKNSLKRNNESYNLKNNFGIKHLNNKNRLVDKTLMNTRKQNSKAKTDKKRKDNGKIILNNLNPSRRYIHIDPGLNSILDSLLLDNDGHVRHFSYDRSVERRMEDYNNYDRARQLERQKRREERQKRRVERQKRRAERQKRRAERQKRRVERQKRRAEREKRREENKKRREERKKRLEKEITKKRQVEQQKPQKKNTVNKNQRQTTTGYSKKARQLEREKRREERRKQREREKYKKSQSKLKKEKKKRRQERQKQREERQKVTEEMRILEDDHRVNGHTYEHSSGTITIDGKKMSLNDINHTESHQGSGKSAVKISNFIQGAKGSLLGDITINGKTFSLDDLKNKNVKIEY